MVLNFFMQTVAPEMAKGDIILRALIGMAFIMTLMFLAAIVTGVIGRAHEKKMKEQRSASEQHTAENDVPED